MSFIGLLRTLEQITRPPRHPNHDTDDYYDPTADTSMCDCGHQVRYCECPINDEPGLTDDELAAVRGLISQPRCARCDSKLGEAATVSDIASGMFCSSRCQKAAEIQQALTDARKSSASNHTGTGAEPAPSPTIVQSAPPPTVDGEGPASVRDIPPSPEAGRPNLGLDRRHEAPWYVEDFTTSSLTWQPQYHMPCGISNRWHEVIAHFDSLAVAQAVVDVINIREARPPEQDSEDAAAEWIGEAVVVISEVLSHHVTVPLDDRQVMCLCIPQKALIFPNNAAWRAHVAPLIANALPKPPGYAAIHDLRQAADLIGALGHPSDPRDYDYGALAERLGAAADHLAQPNK